MIRRYEAKDVPAVKAALESDIYMLTLLSTYIEAASLQNFDLWLTDSLNVIIFRHYNSFYIKLYDGADFDEAGIFLDFMPMMRSLCGSPCDVEAILHCLIPAASSATVEIAELENSAMLKCSDIKVVTSKAADDYKEVYLLLQGGVADDRAINEYTATRLSLDKNGLGKTLFYKADGEVCATASTAGEIKMAALISDVAVKESYRRKRLATVIVSHLCESLIKGGKMPFVAYTTAEAKMLYEQMGFKHIKSNTLLYFD